MRRWIVALLAMGVLSVGLTAQTGSSSGSSSSGSDGSSSSGSSSGGSSDGSSSGSSEGSSSGSSDGSSGSSDGNSSGNSSEGGGTDVTGPNTAATLPDAPDNFTLPEPDQNGNVTVPEDPPKELKGKSAPERLAALPLVPTSCLDEDVTLLDIFLPAASIPLRFTYCLLYVGTIARVPGEIAGGGSSSASNVERATTRTDSGQTIRVQLVRPDKTQRPLATLALIILIVVVSIVIGFLVGRRRGEIAARIEGQL